MRALLFAAICVAGLAPAAPAQSARKLIDIVWVWGIPEGNGAYEMGQGDMVATEDPARFAQADARSKAAMLGVHNIVMAGSGLPNDLARAEQLSKGIAGMKRIGWELTPDNGEGPPFVYTEKLHILKGLKSRYPQIEAVSIDDMLTSQRKKGLAPEHIAVLRKQLKAEVPGVNMWGIVYTMNLKDPLLPACLKSLDVVNLWTWQAEEIRNLDANFSAAEKIAGRRPIVLGLYMYDYGKNRKMPRELMEMQCAKALALAKQGRVAGIVFLAVNNDADTIVWTRDWIRSVAGERLGSRP